MLMFDAGSEEHLQEVAYSLINDTVENIREQDETCAVETTDADDDADEFVEWNEGDGNVVLALIVPISVSVDVTISHCLNISFIIDNKLFFSHTCLLNDICIDRESKNMSKCAWLNFSLAVVHFGDGSL